MKTSSSENGISRASSTATPLLCRRWVVDCKPAATSSTTTCTRSPKSGDPPALAFGLQQVGRSLWLIGAKLEQMPALARLDLARRSFEDEFPRGHKAETIALLGLFQVVRGDEHGRARVGEPMMMRQNARRAIGSTPEVGSSRKSTLGSCMIEEPNATRCFQPPGRRPVTCFFLTLQARELEHPAQSFRHARPPRHAVDAGKEIEVFVDR